MNEGRITLEDFLAIDMEGKTVIVLCEKQKIDYRGIVSKLEFKDDWLTIDCLEFASRKNNTSPWEDISDSKTLRVNLSTRSGFFKAAEAMFLVYTRNDPDTELLIFKP